MTDQLLITWTAEPAILAILALWGFGEAVALPVVPDVLLGLLALATPAALGLPLAAAIGGGVTGAVVLAFLRRHDARLMDRVIALQPGLGARGMSEAHRRVSGMGAARAFAQVGPGLPLKAYVATLIDAEPATSPGRLSGLALLNRVTRIVPVVVVFAGVGHMARLAGASPSSAIGAYVAGWIGFYGWFWWARRS